ncbi:MAG: anaerobic ribonucleoside-triphosphate reductase activating protein [Desulfuromonas sp.]|nr:MAG: anaerobic ribonucleoside-triphosphate reductase activating protein [Desulfuromonas sp.]
MAIKGFQGTSLVDYPGKMAALIFFGGCNLTCPFCHNPALVIAPQELPDMPYELLLEELETRRGFIDGVVITGGEPTLAKELPDLLRQLRRLNLQIKLDTNGLLPDTLSELINEKLLDLVALDLKTAPHRYNELHSTPIATDLLKQSIALLKGQKSCQVEFRTTCVPGLIGEKEIHLLGTSLSGAKEWSLQQYAPGHALDPAWKELRPYSSADLYQLARIAGTYVPTIHWRGR